MGWVLMSERDLNRVEVLSQVDDGRLTVEDGAVMLALSRRQVFRLLKGLRSDGVASIRHKARGRRPNNRICDARRALALSLIRESYADYGPTLAAEMLEDRVKVLSQVTHGEMTVVSLAHVLGLSRSQVHRLLHAFRKDGAPGIRHKARGRPSNNAIDPAVREYAVTLFQDHYGDFGPTLAAEMLAKHHGLKVSRETLRKWMMADGLWLSRRQRRSFQQPRLRRDCYGELIQIDGSEHHWFEE